MIDRVPFYRSSHDKIVIDKAMIAWFAPLNPQKFGMRSERTRLNPKKSLEGLPEALASNAAISSARAAQLRKCRARQSRFVIIFKRAYFSISTIKKIGR